MDVFSRNFTVDNLTPVGRYLKLSVEEKCSSPCVLCAWPTLEEQIARRHNECTLDTITLFSVVLFLFRGTNVSNIAPF